MQETQKTQGPSLSWGDPLKEGMAIHSSILAWRIAWAEEPGGLQSIGSQQSDTIEVTEHTCIQNYKNGIIPYVDIVSGFLYLA